MPAHPIVQIRNVAPLFLAFGLAAVPAPSADGSGPPAVVAAEPGGVSVVLKCGKVKMVFRRGGVVKGKFALQRWDGGEGRLQIEDADGQILASTAIVMDRPRFKLRFEGVACDPLPTLARVTTPHCEFTGAVRGRCR